MTAFERIEIALLATCGTFFLFLVVMLAITLWRSPRIVMRPFLDRFDRLIAAVEHQIGLLTDGQTRLIDEQVRLRNDMETLQRSVERLRPSPDLALEEPSRPSIAAPPGAR